MYFYGWTINLQILTTYCVLAIFLRAKMKVLFIVVLYEDGCYKKTTTRPNTIKVWIYGRAMAMSKERCGARNWQRRPLNWKLTVVGLLLLILPFEAAKAISARKCYQLFNNKNASLNRTSFLSSKVVIARIFDFANFFSYMEKINTI